MNILLMTGSLPYPPLQGGALRSFGIIDGLSKAGHTITLFSIHDGSTDPRDTPLEVLCQRIITAPPPPRPLRARLRDLLTTDAPDIARRLWSDEAAARLRDLLANERFDLVQADGLEVACYLPLAKDSGAKLCYDSFNAEYALQAEMGVIDRREVLSGSVGRIPGALYSWVQAQRLRRYEASVCRQADIVLAVSPEDAASLAKITDKRIGVVPNGIFTARYDGDDWQNLGTQALVFTGTMDYRPNVDAMLWFCGEVLPRVRAKVPDATLYIVGQKPHPRVQALHTLPGVHVTGKVPAVQPYLRGAAVYVVPMRMGGGTRLKVLEAMATGCAVVSTTIGASGLQYNAKQGMIVADTADDFAYAVCALLDDRERCRAMGAAARAYVRAHYDWAVLIPHLLTLYQEAGL